MNYNDAASIFNYITAQPLPAAWSTPQSLKRSYAATLASAGDYNKAIDASLAQYAGAKDTAKSGEYKALVDMVNRQYEQAGTRAARESLAAGKAATAGFGESYAAPATAQAHTAYMAARGALTPQLLSAAADAQAKNRAGIAAGVKAMSAQRDLRSSALRKLFEAQLGGIRKEEAAQRAAAAGLLDSLGEMYAHQASLEQAAAAAAARASSGSRRSSTKRSSTKRSSSKKSSTAKKSSAKKVATQAAAKSAFSKYEKAYHDACENHPWLISVLRTPAEYTRRGRLEDYIPYVQGLIKQYG